MAIDQTLFHLVHEDGTEFQVPIRNEAGDVIGVNEEATRFEYNCHCLKRANAEAG